MRFTVPQFIEHEAKIVGPLTFRQFIYIGLAGGLIFIFYFTFGKKAPLIFLLISIILFVLAAAMAFVKIGGRGLPTILMNVFKFSVSPKMYIWKQKSNNNPNSANTYSNSTN